MEDRNRTPLGNTWTNELGVHTAAAEGREALPQGGRRELTPMAVLSPPLAHCSTCTHKNMKRIKGKKNGFSGV